MSPSSISTFIANQPAQMFGSLSAEFQSRVISHWAPKPSKAAFNAASAVSKP